ncbi:hypothetical protein [Nocardia cyriacigeorgica]|uniref:hypothetical protein n=1 Tax=Nocardia cyriacigeorgica TaxID=135487 RepID=UPI00245577F9|nr:hypothetical protein [Nocardia cyriacigeorgica]
MTTADAPPAPRSNIPRADRPQAARVLAEAFTDDPVWNELKPRRPRRAAAALYWVFRAEVAIAAAALGGYLQATYDADGRVTAVVIAYVRDRPGFPWWTAFFRIPAMLLLGISRTVQAARMATAAESHQPHEPHVYAYYGGSRTLGGGATLIKRVMRMAAAQSLPVYGEAKSEEMLEILRILRWQIEPPIDIGYGRSLTPARWQSEGAR